MRTHAPAMLTAWLIGGETPASLFLILLLALALDAALGDPPWLYGTVPHPVAMIGRLVAFGDRRLNDERAGEGARALSGALLTSTVVLLSATLGWVLAGALQGLPGGWLVEAVLVSMLIAFRGLYDHAAAVARVLGDGLAEGRAAVAHIVGRDPDSLDGPGVARAAVESIAENFSDGVVAPAFWYALLGLPGLCAYKAVNTLDSMIGHKNPRYRAFGRAAARLDDVVNWVPARLAGSLVVLAAAMLPGARAGAAWRTMRRDAPRHRSPNAGWQEAAFAGALGFALAGPRRYRDEAVDDPWMGDGRSDLGAADIRAALRLYLAAAALLAAIVLGVWLLL
jgi:adenosylcobinamide-phosphate synthase